MGRRSATRVEAKLRVPGGTAGPLTAGWCNPGAACCLRPRLVVARGASAQGSLATRRGEPCGPQGYPWEFLLALAWHGSAVLYLGGLFYTTV